MVIGNMDHFTRLFSHNAVCFSRGLDKGISDCKRRSHNHKGNQISHRELFGRLQKAGVTFKQRTLNSLKELTGEYDIIMNCTGLGARKLCDDKRLVSLRGQVLKVYHT